MAAVTVGCVYAAAAVALVPCSRMPNRRPLVRKLREWPLNIRRLCLGRADLRSYYREALTDGPSAWAIEAVDHVMTHTSEADHVLFLPYSRQLHYIAERSYGTPRGSLLPGLFRRPEHPSSVCPASRRSGF